jgi:hypothetical protein
MKTASPQKMPATIASEITSLAVMPSAPRRFASFGRSAEQLDPADAL